MAYTKKEAIYDKKIAPLVTKILEICKAHDIPLVLSVQINDDRKGHGEADLDGNGDPLGPWFCTSVLTNGGPDGAFARTHPQLLRAGAIMHSSAPRESSWAAYSVTDGKATRDAGSDDGYDPGVPGTKRR